ncbi:YafY family protein [Beijerinckia sp. L45]|uniref:helix-turn-helix transcriptional regulator n=1 Tax=Beijerinckia sp. L45 TaxID=1641855 RepID=UPI00131CB651|nr:WYL domain-containing protein [Beijerinckia sp. L45]
MADDERRPWMQNRRLEFIEWKLYWDGALNRSDLENTFSISTPQASVDIRQYREIAGDNISYNATEKAFLPAPGIKPRFLTVSADRLLIQLRAWLTGALPRRDLWFKAMPSIDMAPDLARHVDPDCLRLVLQAMAKREVLEVRYQSLTNDRWREIAPHALAFDGYRWHVRAWACDRDDFRDFVLTRIVEIKAGAAAVFDPDDDIEWKTKTKLLLAPHHGLNEQQSLAIQRDFNMIDGRLEVEVRLSMAYYFIMRMNLDLDLKPSRAQICLENLQQVQSAIEEAKEESCRRIASRKAASGPASKA